MKLSLSIYLMMYSLWLIPAGAADEPSLGNNLAGLLDYAHEHNPEFAASRYEADAAQQRVQSASALPDPVLRTELMDITNQGTNKGTSLLPSQVGGTRYTLMQSVPWFGRRDLQREVAEAQVAQTDGQVTATWAELASKIKSVYAQYYYLSGSERLTRETLDLMTGLEQVTQTRYANGLGAQQDVIRAQVEQTGLSSELLDLENEQHHMHGRLNTLLSRPAMAPLAQPASLRRLPVAAQLDYAVLEQKLRARNTRLLPQAELTYQSALTGYENGKVNFATLLDAQWQILKARQQQLRAQLEAQLRLAEIERLLGEEL